MTHSGKTTGMGGSGPPGRGEYPREHQRGAEVTSLQQYGPRAADEHMQALLADLEQVTFELRWVKCEYRALSDQHAQVKLMHQTVLGQRTELSQQVAGLQAEVERLNEECVLQEQRCLQAETEIRELSKALLSAAGAPQRALAHTAALEAQLDYWKQASTELAAECDRLRDALKAGSSGTARKG